MFNVRPNLRVPGFNVREPGEGGFRLNADGTIGKPPMTAAKPDGDPFDIFEPQPLAAWPPPYLASDPDPLADQAFPWRGQPQMSGGRDSNMQLAWEDSRSVRIPVRERSERGDTQPWLLPKHYQAAAVAGL